MWPHAIVLTGYNDNEETFTFKNSWGTSWGNAGYGKMTYLYFLANYLGGDANLPITIEVY